MSQQNSAEWLQNIARAAGCTVDDLQARVNNALRENGQLRLEPAEPLRADPNMSWSLYKDSYCVRLRTRYPESDHPWLVGRTLDRFTLYCHLNGRRLSEITSLDIEHYVALRRKDAWRNKPIGNRTINNEINALNAVFAFAGPVCRGAGRRNLGLLTSPPFCELLPVDDPNPVVLTADQLARYIDATAYAVTPRLDGCTPQQFWLATLVLSGVTALRRKALLRVPRPDDYQLRELREIVVPPHINKTRRELRITLGRRDEVIELLASLPTRPGEPLLPWKDPEGRPMSLGHFNREMAEFQKRAGITAENRVKTKHLRSTAGTEVGDRLGDAIAKKKLGHSPGSNTFDRHYKGRRPRDVDRDASDLMADLLFRSMKGDLRALITPPTAQAEAESEAEASAIVASIIGTNAQNRPTDFLSGL